MKSGQKTIKELFCGQKVFEIPEYQRPYAWEEKHLTAFVEDINQKTDRNHFFGTILFREKPRQSGNFTHIDIVDGQQRITTLVIFMKLLLKHLVESGSNIDDSLEDTYIQSYGEYKLRVLPVDNVFFKNYILQDNLDAKSFAKTPAQNRLFDAKEWFKDWIKEKPIEILQELIGKIEKMRVSTYSVEDNAEAALIFETTNDRGKPLTNLDKIKSFLMYKCYLVSDDIPENLDSLLKDLQDLFGEIYRDVDVIAGRIDEDLILQYHCIGFEAWETPTEYRQPVTTVRQKVNKLIKKGNNSEAKEFIQRYSRELRESFANMKELIQDKDSQLRDIFILNRPAIAYHLLIKTYKYDTSDEKQDFRQVTRLMEIICFRAGIEWHRVDKGRGKLYKLSRNFDGDFNQLISGLKKFINEFCSNDRFRDQLRLSNLPEAVKPNDLRYLLWKYESHLRTVKQPVSSKMFQDEFTNTDPRTKFTIEHIYSQNPKENGDYANKSEPILLNKDYLHRIGNLVLDSTSSNSSKSNEDFDFKNKQYYRKSTLKQQQELENFASVQEEKLTWDEASIDCRNKKIVNFALEYWNHEKV